MAAKYGNFSSTTIIKLVSKYNKKATEGSDLGKIEAREVGELITQELNRRLEEDTEASYTLVHSEVARFNHMNGFINIFMQNEQFMDRVQLMIRKKH